MPQGIFFFHRIVQSARHPSNPANGFARSANQGSGASCHRAARIARIRWMESPARLSVQIAKADHFTSSSQSQ